MVAKSFLPRNLVCLLAIGLVLGVSQAFGANFTTGTDTAQKFGTHEIVLKSEKNFLNPFEIAATVKFIPPSGEANAVTMSAFYDGGDIWRARVYVIEAGPWAWRSACVGAPGLDNKSGTFTAINSLLKGMLRKHKVNPKAWMTDDGQGFLNISDTAYKLFNGQEALWQHLFGILQLRVSRVYVPLPWEDGVMIQTEAIMTIGL
jgi:hypothetical protein